MRIRNKLITVQLVLTLTLILSIIIIASHMSTVIRIKNTEIALNHINTDFSRYINFNNRLLTTREDINKINRELNTKTNKLKNDLSIINNKIIIKKSTVYPGNRNTSKGYTHDDMTKRFNSNILSVTVNQLSDLMSKITDRNTLDIIKKNGIKDGWDKFDRIIRDRDIQPLINAYKQHISAFDVFMKEWTAMNNAHSKHLKSVQKFSLIRTYFFILVTIMASVIISFNITNKITKNMNAVNKSLLKMSKGDFTSNLDIVAGDEFGDLSRNFNTFIDQLWKKLDSMNVIMSDIGHAMNEDLDLTKIHSNIINNVTNHIISDGGAIFKLKDGYMHQTYAKGHFPPFFPVDEDLSLDRPAASRYLQNHPIDIETPIVKECITKKEPVIVKRCNKDPIFPQCRDMDSALYIGSFMMVPLLNAGEVIGLFILIRTTHKSPFSDLDITNFISFSDYAALTIDTLEKYNELLEKFEMQKEIGVAADIQKNLIPDKMPKIKGITSGAYTLAAKGVSGDYYDFFQMNRTTVGATVCDVAGKGVPASLVMVMIRTILRLVASPKRGAAETLTLLNKSISGKINVDRYATMGFFKIDLETMKLSYSNAAHHPIQIFRQETRKFYAIDSPGLPVGIDRDSQFSEKRISLSPGDIIFMYTDGFPEARNPDGDEYSTNRMLREIRLHCHKNAEEILDSVVTDMQKFTLRAKQHDDQTILILKIDEEM